MENKMVNFAVYLPHIFSEKINANVLLERSHQD